MNGNQISVFPPNAEASLQTVVRRELQTLIGTKEEQVKAVEQIVVKALLRSTAVTQHIQALVAEQIREELQKSQEQEQDKSTDGHGGLCYHSSPELRAIIKANLEELKEHPMFCGVDFSLTTLKAYVKSLVTLRRDDTRTRFSYCIWNAVVNWPKETSPFEKATIRGYYKFR